MMENMLIIEVVTVVPLLIMTKEIGSALPLYIQDPSKRYDKLICKAKIPRKRPCMMTFSNNKTISRHAMRY
jgi:hypothetical protein